MKIFTSGSLRRASRLLALFLMLRARLTFAQPLPALRPPRGEIAPTFWEQHGWQIAITSLVIIIVAGVVIVVLTRQKPKPPEPPEALARRSLAALRGRPVDGKLLVDISRIF